jgi:hypothetical protein
MIKKNSGKYRKLFVKFEVLPSAIIQGKVTEDAGPPAWLLDLGDRVRDLRKFLDFDTWRCARLMRLYNVSLVKLERGEYSPQLKNLKFLCDYAEIPLSKFLKDLF